MYTLSLKFQLLHLIVNWNFHFQSGFSSLMPEESEVFVFLSLLYNICSVNIFFCACDCYQASDTHLNCSVAWCIEVCNMDCLILHLSLSFYILK